MKCTHTLAYNYLMNLLVDGETRSLSQYSPTPGLETDLDGRNTIELASFPGLPQFGLH